MRVSFDHVSKPLLLQLPGRKYSSRHGIAVVKWLESFVVGILGTAEGSWGVAGVDHGYMVILPCPHEHVAVFGANENVLPVIREVGTCLEGARSVAGWW